jgi:radical SAM superfamily enzyme YgiQ (UPF0313 family)
MATTPRRSGSRKAGPLLEDEQGTIRGTGRVLFALGYPARYRVGASSLGFQTVYRALNQSEDLSCGRFFLQEKNQPERAPVVAETGRKVSSARAIGFSVACETELLSVIDLLVRSGIEPLARKRKVKDPPVLIGGPLTAVDPRLVAPLADVVVVGEGELALPLIGRALTRATGRAELVERLADQGGAAGIWCPEQTPDPPPPCRVPLELLPAVAATWSRRAELKNLFLIEATRGCSRRCTFCVLAAGVGQDNFRPVPLPRIIEHLPQGAPGVGLVGAAITDHPKIEELVQEIVDRGFRVSLSSVRADRLTPQLIHLLRRGGLQSLTLSADGASDRLRRAVRKGIKGEQLLQSGRMLAEQGVSRLKLYCMVGLPDEEERDIAELAELARELAQRLSLTLAVQAFVPKPNTPLAKIPMTEIPTLRSHLQLLKKLVAGRARIAPTSPRWSWLDWKLTHAGLRAAPIAIAAYRDGGSFAAWRQALARYGL